MTLAEPDLAPTPVAVQPAPALLDIRDLRVGFETPDGERVVVAVDGVSLQVPEGGTLGLVGESGSGKSVTCLSVLRLLAEQGRILGGEVHFNGRDLLTLSPDELQALRGGDIAMIFQDPMSSLNPVKRVGWQIAEALIIHERLTLAQAETKAVDLLGQVGIPEPKLRSRAFPHQLSGGMCQRVMIAMALACRPKLLIADEPTTALDVTIQAQILQLLRKLADETGTAVVIITHDLGVVAEVADHVAVMYAGRVVESAPVADLFSRPRHPYTAGLLGSLAQPQRTGTPPADDRRCGPGARELSPGLPLCPALFERQRHLPNAGPKAGRRDPAGIACHHPERRPIMMTPLVEFRHVERSLSGSQLPGDHREQPAAQARCKTSASEIAPGRNPRPRG